MGTPFIDSHQAVTMRRMSEWLIDRQSWQLVVGVVGVVLAALGLLWYLTIRGNSRQEPPTPRTHYEQIGIDKIRLLVERFYGRVLGDPALAQFFDGLDSARMTHLKRHLVQIVANILGGPHPTSTVDLAAAHQPLGITAGQYWRLVGHLQDVMVELEVSREIFVHVVGALYDVQGAIVQEPAHIVRVGKP